MGQVTRGPQQVTLVPFTAHLLTPVQQWFEHPEVQRRLGGTQWPVQALRASSSGIGGSFRGKTVVRTHMWVALDADRVPVAQIGGDVYDRWVTYDGAQQHAPTLSCVIPGLAMGMSYVVDPCRWGRGVGRAVLAAAVNDQDVADVCLFTLGIDTGNVASRRCASAAGFVAAHAAPDWEDIVYYFWRRPPE